jgi:small subunit ribosomal protein S2
VEELKGDDFSRIYAILYRKDIEKKKKLMKKNVKQFFPLKFLKKQNIFWSLRFRNFINEMVKKKISYGQHKSHLNPQFKPYLIGFFNKYTVINLNYTLKQLQNALKILYKVISQKGNVFLVGTEILHSDHITLFGDRFNISYVKNPQWTGGILSNMESIKKSIAIYKNGEGRSKKHILYSGLTNLNKIDLLIVLNPQKNLYAINEANKLRIPVIAIVDTHCFLKGVDYPIVSNNESIKTVYFLIQLLYWSFTSGVERFSFYGQKKAEKGFFYRKKRKKKKKRKNYR